MNVELYSKESICLYLVTMYKNPSARTIWMIIPTFHPVVGGTQTQVRELGKRLMAKEGMSIHVLTRRHAYAHPHGLPKEDEVDGIPITRVYSRGGGKVGALLFVIGSLWYLIGRGRADIYHSHDTGASGWLAIIASHLLRGQSIVKLRSGKLRYKSLVSTRMGRLRFSALLRLASRVVVVNSEMETAVQTLGIPPMRVVRILNGVDTDFYSPPSPEERREARQRISPGKSDFIFLFVGRLQQIKGLDVLLGAWSLLPNHIRSSATLLLVGDGNEHQNLADLVCSLRMKESVHIVGERRNVRDYYWASDVFILPSRTEGLSNAMIEAMSCGLPVVASRVGGSLDLIEEAKHGYLFDSENCEDLAEKICSIINVRLSWHEMGAMARDKVIRCSDLELAATRFKELYDQLV